MGSLRVLADSFSPSELNKKGFSLYTKFRPEVNGWGKKGTLHLKKILQLRPKQPAGRQKHGKSAHSTVAVPLPNGASAVGLPPGKRRRGVTLEEFEAQLDADEGHEGIGPEIHLTPLE